MNASQLREFAQPGILAAVMLQGGNDFLDVDENGILASVPSDVRGFHLMVATDKSRTFMVQKHVGQEGGGYHRNALSKLEGFPKSFKAEIMREPIEVVRVGKNVWTSWHQQKPNRVDCWQLEGDGDLGLFQVGVFTHDDGRTWKLHGEYRWKGKLYDSADGLVAVPEHQKWGSLDAGTAKRTQIFEHPDFIALLPNCLGKWDGKDLEVALPSVPQSGQAVVQWYITFAGQKGMGPVNLHASDGQTGWVHGNDIVGLKPDSDGEIRLWQGDVVRYDKLVENWGSKKNGPPKLTGVRLVSRAW